MAFELIWFVRAIEVLALGVAFVLVTLAYRGYRRHRSRSMLSAAVGFFLLGAASLLEGLFFEVVGLPLLEAHVIRATVTALGFFVLLYSIYRTA